MRALRKMAAAPGIDLCEIEKPEPGAGEVLIKVERAGLCGTDVHLYKWDGGAPGSLTPPQTLGHEFCGEIVEIGAGVPAGLGRDELHVGQFVSVEGHIVCGRCRNCRAGRKHMCQRTIGIGVNRDGGFADYVVVPAANVWVHQFDIDPDLAALFDPLGNAIHTCQQMDITGWDVLITGAGPIGCMCAALARHHGARYVVVTDLNDKRLDIAANCGADRVVNVTRETVADVMGELKIREGFDAGMEMSGSPGGLNALIQHCTYGATIGLLGLPSAPFPIDWSDVITKMITIKGVYGREMFDTWYLSSFMLQTSKTLRERISSIVTDRFEVNDYAQAFERAAAADGGKVLIDWSK